MRAMAVALHRSGRGGGLGRIWIPLSLSVKVWHAWLVVTGFGFVRSASDLSGVSSSGVSQSSLSRNDGAAACFARVAC